MFSSAVLRVAAPDRSGAAEAPTPNSSKPRPVSHHRDGADRNRSPIQGRNRSYVERYQERDRSPDRSDLQHVGEEGPRVPGAREGREEVTAPAVEQPDLARVERDLVAVLTAHGITGDTIQLAVYPIEQAGQTVGVSISGFAYTRPAGLPTTKPATADPFTAMAEDLEAVS